jgi:nucleoside-diphosphate-sugar epimerase
VNAPAFPNPIPHGGRILLAGGGGFLGSNIARRLLERGSEVWIVDNFCTGRPVNVQPLIATYPDRCHLVDHDVCEPLLAHPELQGPFHAVLNAASPASPPAYVRLAIETLRVGSVGTENLIHIALRDGARFLQFSTSEVYGDPLVHPQPETYWGHVNPIGMRSMYDEAKRYGEALCVAYERDRGLDLRLLRIFNTYGPGMRADDGRVVTNFINQALSGEAITVYGEGQQTRSFCYVDDEAEGIIRLLDSDHRGPMNVGNPGEFTIMELAKLVLELTGSASPIEYRPMPPNDPKERQPDITQARQILGWEPTIALRDGLVKTIAHFAAERG